MTDLYRKYGSYQIKFDGAITDALHELVAELTPRVCSVLYYMGVENAHSSENTLHDAIHKAIFESIAMRVKKK